MPTALDTTTPTGLRKAAILLVQMGRERSAKVLAQLREPEVEALTGEIMRLRALRPEQVDAVVMEFAELATAHRVVGQGGLEFAQEVLSKSLGADRARAVLERLSAAALNAPFLFLHQVDPRQILTFLSGEHPQTVALVLAHLRPEQASSILGALPPATAAEVAHRIATMEPASPEVVRRVEGVLQRRTGSVLQTSSRASSVGGVDPLVGIINRADRATEKAVLDALTELAPEIAEQVRARLFVFDDITTLDDRSVQLVLRGVETADLATALKGVKDEVRDVVLRNLSERARANLLEEIDLMGPVRVSAVDESQAKVVQVIRSLEESGEIVLTRGDDDALVG